MADREHMLRELFADIAEKNNYKDATVTIEAINSGGANYSSVLYNATISAPNKKELHLFAKVANLGEEVRSMMPTSSIFEPERFMYMDLAEGFRRMEQECEVPEEDRYVFPKFYGYNPTIYEETVVLEDLVARGYTVHDRLNSVDWLYASKAVEALGKFHALGMAYMEQGHEECNQQLKKMSVQMKDGFKLIDDSFKKFLTTALTVVKQENKERLQKYYDNECSRDGSFFERCTKAHRRCVIVHGDYRPSNIMHKVNEDGTVELIPVDYQTFREGCGLVDLLYFIFCGSDAEFRAQYYQRLVDHYYDSLRSYLLKLRLDPDKIYSREDFDYELQEALPYGLFCAIFALPIITVEADDAPDLNEGDIFDNMAGVNTSRHYPSRLNGVVDDYIRWGIL